MQALRNASRLARLVLAWFVLTLGIAIASPAVKPLAFELVCSGAGSLKVLVKGEAGSPPVAGHHTLDCPLCVGADAPTGDVSGAEPAPAPVVQVTQRRDRGGAIRPAAAPPPARGPPPAAHL